MKQTPQFAGSKKAADLPKMLGQVEKSIGDSNDYHLFELPNKLQVLLIEDNNRQKSDGQPMAYCSLAVNAGSFNDPVDR